MIYNRLHRFIVAGITGIVLCSVAGAWFLVSGTSLFLAFAFACIVITLAIMLVRKMEKTNRQLETFFRSINNNDFNVHFTEKEDDKFLNGLFREMNRIMMQFEENQAQLEERRLYYESIIRVLTHEIRNSITPISSLSADLINYTDEYGKEGIVDGLQTINQQVQQLNTFLNAYHRLTHLPDPVKTKVDIHTLFDKLNRLLSSEEGSKNIRYSLPEPVEILLDQNLVTLALINLIHNAQQATANHPEPQIIVEAGRGEKAPLFIQVCDNGEGIPPERLEDVFIPFYSTKKEGSGIGLPLSRRIMQLHGGELTVSSSPGEGAVFRMSFP
ncbi:signal transduction histidine kinase [Parabacteroides sp. PF5-5]|uniref:sensor histidine kinase n=1 Tax=unclassified Parabacteroides TaxID=2649774 RepID=UPI002473987B|nr:MULTISPECIES: HAMP domain-containing sensor histidine kinase [unclassified Parabacteroides]MDH6304541.1 signal transduction histidine kinase [Parabacteroides sp. PH5-39]MDH6315307.1 signal transduction histidine kinase [Parabacteroides sp. PF5-13]MDH6319199.1 signal transduction histidine kinase [Parabacteroides sp. PH5-13]MDH6322930.1 signal transduction histidine kinase [Parabacteroides sp. PH5-8]MDH6326498.1 signal transduction histidine kinase [Parabacteroides sp. PH5-41]